MHSSRIRLAKAFSFLVAAPLVLAVLSALPQHAAPQPPSSAIALGIDPAQSKVHWVLGTTLHAVHGTFAFKNGTLHVDPRPAKPVVRSLYTQQAETAATMGATFPPRVRRK